MVFMPVLVSEFRLALPCMRYVQKCCLSALKTDVFICIILHARETCCVFIYSINKHYSNFDKHKCKYFTFSGESMKEYGICAMLMPNSQLCLIMLLRGGGLFN